MKKGFVALLVVLALVVLISPAIIGRLAEQSVDENINWAARESGDLVVSSDSFDRGWFSSEGQHRVEVKEGNLKAMVEALGGSADSGDLPVLVINTRLDHGLIPVASMSREKGSLAPGLGSAVSTLSVEFADGEAVELPGTIYSKVGLSGELQSNYVLEPGSHEDGDTTASWGATDIDVTTNPNSGNVVYSGNIGTLSIVDERDSFTIDDLTFSGQQSPTKFGFATGEMKLVLDSLSISKNGALSGGMKRMSIDGATTLDDDQVSGRTVLEIESQPLPMFGEISVIADISIEEADAAAIGGLQQTIDSLGIDPDAQEMFALMEDDLKRLFASGFSVRFDKLDVGLPMGTVTTKLDIQIAEEDLSTFEWTSLLLGTEASADISVPEALVDMALQMNPQAAAVVGMGFLEKNGDVYEMAAEYKKGLLTINGAPVPIPMGAFQ